MFSVERENSNKHGTGTYYDTGKCGEGKKRGGGVGGSLRESIRSPLFSGARLGRGGRRRRRRVRGRGEGEAGVLSAFLPTVFYE